MSSDEDDIADRVSNRVPITVNGQKAEAVCSTGSNVPNCWMSKAYFTKIGLDSENIEQVPGVTKLRDAFGSEVNVLGVPKEPLTLLIGDCPAIFKIRPFILEFNGYDFWNEFQFTYASMKKLAMSFSFVDGTITLGTANNFSVLRCLNKPNEPMVMASLFKGPDFDDHQYKTWLASKVDQDV